MADMPMFGKRIRKNLEELIRKLRKTEAKLNFRHYHTGQRRPAFLCKGSDCLTINCLEGNEEGKGNG